MVLTHLVFILQVPVLTMWMR